MSNIPPSVHNINGNNGCSFIFLYLCLDLLLSVLHNEDVSTCGEALLYCVGTLKFLSGNSAILRLLLDKNCIGVAQKLIQGLHAVEEIHFTIAGHILVQVNHFISDGQRQQKLKILPLEC